MRCKGTIFYTWITIFYTWMNNGKEKGSLSIHKTPWKMAKLSKCNTNWIWGGAEMCRCICDMAVCILVHMYRRFGRMFFLHLSSIWVNRKQKGRGTYGQVLGQVIDMSKYMVRRMDCGKTENLVTWKCPLVTELMGY